MSVTCLKPREILDLREIGTSGPIDADENGPQRAAQASSICCEREGASCEYIEIMQILPGSSNDTPVIDAPRAICNMGGRECKPGKQRPRSSSPAFKGKADIKFEGRASAFDRHRINTAPAPRISVTEASFASLTIWWPIAIRA
jgi:hypothetical protein